MKPRFYTNLCQNECSIQRKRQNDSTMNPKLSVIVEVTSDKPSMEEQRMRERVLYSFSRFSSDTAGNPALTLTAYISVPSHS